MSAKISIKAKHVLIFGCPGCPDKCEKEIGSDYGGDTDIVEFAEVFAKRHGECLERINAAIARKEAEGKRVVGS